MPLMRTAFLRSFNLVTCALLCTLRMVPLRHWPGNLPGHCHPHRLCQHAPKSSTPLLLPLIGHRSSKAECANHWAASTDFGRSHQPHVCKAVTDWCTDLEPLRMSLGLHSAIGAASKVHLCHQAGITDAAAVCCS